MTTTKNRIFFTEDNPCGISLKELIQEFKDTRNTITKIVIEYPTKEISRKRNFLTRRKRILRYTTKDIEVENGIPLCLSDDEAGIVILGNNASLLKHITENPVLDLHPQFKTSQGSRGTSLYIPEEYIKNIE